MFAAKPQGTEIGSYKILEKIAEGFESLIYKAIDTETGSIVAIKEVPIDNGDKTIRKIRGDIDMLFDSKHENMVKYYSLYLPYTFSEHFYLIQEYVDSTSLASIIAQFGPFPEALVTIYIKQVLKGLEYLHSKKISHGHIQAANLLATKEGQIKISNLRRPKRRIIKEDEIYWMAPEVVETGQTHRFSDIWSLGCTVIELLTGSPPYYDLVPVKALFKIVEDDHPPFPAGITENCKDFLMSCLKKEKTERTTAKDLLRHPWIRSASPKSPQRNPLLRLSSQKAAENEEGEPEQIPKSPENKERRMKIELDDLINDLKSLDQLVNIKLVKEKMIRVIEILEVLPSAKEHFLAKYGLIRLVDILKNEEVDLTITQAALKIINQMIENDVEFQEKTCLNGVLSYMVKYTEAKYPRYLRVEAAYYLGYLGRNTSILKMIITAGGLKGYVELLDENWKENDDLTRLGIDSLIWIFEINVLNAQELCHILCKFGVISRLVPLLEIIHHSRAENASSYLLKALNILLIFAMCEEKEIRESFCQDKALLLLQSALKNSHTDLTIVSKVFRITKFISKDPVIAYKLQLFDMISIILKLISEAVPWPEKNLKGPEIVINLVEILINMCKESDICQEEIAMKGGVKLLIYLVQKTTKEIERITLPFLCEIVKSSSLAREKLWEQGGPRIFLEYLDDEDYQEKILDVVIVWRGWEKKEVDDFLMETGVLNKIIEVIHRADKVGFQKRVVMYSRLIKCSSKLARKLAENLEFLKEIAERLSGSLVEGSEVRVECANPTAMVKKELLDILLYLCERSPDSIKMLNQYKLYLAVKNMMENETAVFLKSKASQLWGIYLAKLKENVRSSEKV